MSNESQPHPDTVHEPTAPPASLREINSRDLMLGQREIVIRHGNEAYRLSVTRSGKLILRK